MIMIHLLSQHFIYYFFKNPQFFLDNGKYLIKKQKQNKQINYINVAYMKQIVNKKKNHWLC